MKQQSEDFEESIIGDVRRARAAFWARFGNDPQRMLRHFLDEQAKEPDKVVNLRNRRQAEANRS